MDCRECKKLIVDSFTGSLPSNIEEKVKRHVATCDECRKLYEQKSAITDGLRSLDSNAYRSESIAAFGRLALMVRSYRSSASVLDIVFLFNRMKVASVAFVILIVMIGLSSLNFSYSYTNGASMQISFDPPLKKLESLDTDDFNRRINTAIDGSIGKSIDDVRVSWAVALDRESLKSISIDVQTDEASEIVGIYNALLEQYPTFSYGHVSVSPLKEQVNAPVYKYVLSRKRDAVADDEIRRIVASDFQSIATSADNRVDSYRIDVEKIKKLIEEELPAIRELIGKMSEKQTGSEATAESGPIVTQELLGGAQVQPDLHGLNQSEFLKNEIIRIFKQKGLSLSDSVLNRLLKVEYIAPSTRIIVGDTNNLFSPSAVGGWGLTIIRGSGENIRLNGFGEIVNPAEIDNVLDGFMPPDALEKLMLARLSKVDLPNEKILIEALKGGLKAEITISSDSAKVELTSDSGNDTTPERYQDDNDNTKKISAETFKEREIIFRSSDDIDGQLDRKVPMPIFSNRDGVLPEYILERDLDELINGKITTDELEKNIEERLKSDNILPSYQNIFLVRSGKAITVKIAGRNVKIDISDWVSSSSDGNAVVVTFKEPGSQGSGSDD